MTVIEIRPHRWGWKVFEAQGVESVFPGKRQAMSYAEGRAWFRLGEIRIFDSRGNLEDCAVATKNGFRLAFYKEGLCAIVQKEPPRSN